MRILPKLCAVLLLGGCAASPPLTANLDTYKAGLVDYAHDGRYARDQAEVARQAEAWLTEESGKVRKPAIVLDIDETSLSNWDELAANGLTFRMDGPCDNLPKGPCGLTAWNQRAQAAAIQPTLHLFYAARRLNVPVFFITGRDESIRAATELNLRRAGYKDWAQLIMRPAGTQDALRRRLQGAATGETRGAGLRHPPDHRRSAERPGGRLCGAGVPDAEPVLPDPLKQLVLIDDHVMLIYQVVDVAVGYVGQDPDLLAMECRTRAVAIDEDRRVAATDFCRHEISD